MGFSCPVCADPQADGVHLANHLAITAVTRGGDHERWLDDQVPEWEQLGEAELAEEVVELATDAEYPQVFEDTTGDHPEGEHSHDTEESLPPGADMLTDDVDEDTEAVIREAMEMTRERVDGEASDSNSETE